MIPFRKKIIYFHLESKKKFYIGNQMGWYRPHSTLNKVQETVVDRCINCGDSKEIKTYITMEIVLIAAVVYWLMTK